jgi:hypothetical protein
LVHHPVLDRQGEIVTTAVTNLDLHDISRSAYTFGVSPFFVVHPVQAQRELCNRVKTHWVDGSGARRIPDRRPPMSKLRIVDHLDQALLELGSDVEIWSTSAQGHDRCLPHERARELLRGAGAPVLILFGTGWGLAREVMNRSHQVLAPIASPRADGYNHLSVRAAAAITFDRLLS